MPSRVKTSIAAVGPVLAGLAVTAGVVLGDQAQADRPWLVAALFITALALMVAHIWAIITAKDRGARIRYTLSFVLSYAACLIGCGLIEAFYPVLQPMDKFQSKILDLLERRNTEYQGVFRGEQVYRHYNQLGWSDGEHSRTKANGQLRLVFIGDSFLEARSYRNLAARVEA